jgi:DNA-directed RNA polymerase II subunit RPB2
MVRGEKGDFYIAVCNKTGSIAIYNEAKNLFLSPFADGPINFVTNPDGTQNIKNLSRFGRSFSILRVPYSLKLLMQELQVMNVQMRIITEDNIDQLMSLSYSNNISKLLQLPDDADLKKAVDTCLLDIKRNLDKPAAYQPPSETPVLPDEVPFENPVVVPTENLVVVPSEEYPQAVSPAYVPSEIQPDAVSPAYIPSPVVEQPSPPTILEVENPPEKEEEKEEEESEQTEQGEKKIILTEEPDAKPSSTEGTRKIIL